MGDHETKYRSDGALIALPSPKLFSKKLKKLEFRHRHVIVIGNRRFWPLLPLLIKAEMNPLLTIVEIASTLVVILCWVQAVFFATALPFVGGVALFISLTILHYWYGK